MTDLPDGSGLFVAGQPVSKADVQNWIDAITLWLQGNGAPGGDPNALVSIASAGAGLDLHQGIEGGVLTLRRITARGAALALENGGLVLDVATEANAARNLGTGAPLFAGRASDGALEFRSIVGVDGVIVEQSGDRIAVRATQSPSGGLTAGQLERLEATPPPGTVLIGDQDYPGAGAFEPATRYLYEPSGASITAHRVFTLPAIEEGWVKNGMILRVARKMLGPGDVWIEGLWSDRAGRRYLHVDQSIWVEAVKSGGTGYWRPVDTGYADATVASVDALIEGTSTAVVQVTPARLREAIERIVDQMLASSSGSSSGGGGTSSLPLAAPAPPNMPIETDLLFDDFAVDPDAYQRDWCAGVEIVTRAGLEKLRIFNRTMPVSRAAHLTSQMPAGSGAFSNAMNAWLGPNGVDVAKLTTWLGVNGVDVQTAVSWPSNPAASPCNDQIRQILQMLEAGAFGAEPILYNWPGTINLDADAANLTHQSASWHDCANVSNATFLGSPTWFVFDHEDSYKDGYGWLGVFQMRDCSNVRFLNFGVHSTVYEAKSAAKDIKGPGLLRVRGGAGFACYGAAAIGAFNPLNFGSSFERYFANPSVTDVRATIAAERCQHGVQQGSVVRSVMNVWADGRAEKLLQRPGWIGNKSHDARAYFHARNVEGGSNAINVSTNYTAGVSVRRCVFTLDYDSPNSTAALRLRMNAIMNVYDWSAFHISDIEIRGVIKGATRAINIELSNQGQGLTSIDNASPLPPVVEMRRIAFRNLEIEANGAGIEDDFGLVSGTNIGPDHHADGLTIGDFFLENVSITGGTRWGARFRGLTHPVSLDRVVSDGVFAFEGCKADIAIAVKDCAIAGGVTIAGAGHVVSG